MAKIKKILVRVAQISELFLSLAKSQGRQKQRPAFKRSLGSGKVEDS
jgi:hypothetical protein